jgi:ergothioneine biosynthesis protein EgtB
VNRATWDGDIVAGNGDAAAGDTAVLGESRRSPAEVLAAPWLERSGILDRYREVRRLTELLAAPLSAEDQTVQTMPDVSPTKWHRAHVSWFFETFLLAPYLPGYEEHHPAFAYLFNSYYEAAGARYPRPARGLVSRPGVSEVAAYRRHVDEGMFRLLERPLDERATFLVELGLQHEQQHQELMLMDVKHVLSMSPLDVRYIAPGAAGPAGQAGRQVSPAGQAGRQVSPAGQAGPGEELAWVHHEAGEVRVGHAGSGFAFDNEGPSHMASLVAFDVADRSVTCAEWLAFIDDGGYSRPELWLSDGWATAVAQGWQAPLYWQCDGGEWTVFTLSGKRPVDPDEPVCHVSYYEADAFARWAGARLPTEIEWEAVVSDRPVAGRFLDPSGLHPLPQSRPAFYGDVWVWTASAYLPYPGFRPWPGAVGEYNGKFMVNQHVLRGGSCATPVGHIRPTYRNFFPPQARWPFTGLRLARDA